MKLSVQLPYCKSDVHTFYSSTFTFLHFNINVSVFFKKQRCISYFQGTLDKITDIFYQLLKKRKICIPCSNSVYFLTGYQDNIKFIASQNSNYFTSLRKYLRFHGSINLILFEKKDTCILLYLIFFIGDKELVDCQRV